MHLSTSSQMAREKGLLESKDEVQIRGTGVIPTCHASYRGAGNGRRGTATGATTSCPHGQGSISFCPLPALRHRALTDFSYLNLYSCYLFTWYANLPWPRGACPK